MTNSLSNLAVAAANSFAFICVQGFVRFTHLAVLEIVVLLGQREGIHDLQPVNSDVPGEVLGI